MGYSANNARIARNTSFLYVRMLLSFGVALYTSRLVLKYLGIEDYGVYSVIGGLVSLFQFVNGTLASSFSRFFAFEIGRNDSRNGKLIFKASVTIVIIFIVLFALTLETIGVWGLKEFLVIPEHRTSAALSTLHFTVLASCFAILQIPLAAAIVAYERMGVYAYIGLLDVFLKLIIVFLLERTQIDKLVFYSALVALTSFLVFVVHFIYGVRRIPVFTLGVSFDKIYLKRLFSFAGWSIIGSVASVFKTQGANILLNIFFGPVVNAARGIAVQVTSAVNKFVQGYSLAFNPQLIKYYAQGDFKAMIQLVVRGSKFSFFLLLILSLPILLETHFLLNLWLIDVPAYTVIFVRLLLVNVLLESFTYALGAAVQATGRIRNYQVIVGGLLLLNLPISYLFLKFGFPPQSTLWVSISLSLLSIVLRVMVLRRLIRVDVLILIKSVFGRSFVVALFVGGASYVLYIVNIEPRVFVVVARLIFSLFISVVFILLFGLSSDEKLWVKKMIRNIAIRFLRK